MALAFLNPTPTGFRYGEYVNGVFMGVVVSGANLTYGPDGTPTGGTVRNLEFVESNIFGFGQVETITRIGLQKTTQVTALLSDAIDLFGSATGTGFAVHFDITGLLSRIDKVQLFGDVRPYEGAIITGGGLNDKINLADNDTFIGTINAGGGKDKINVAGAELTVNGGAGDDQINVKARLINIDGGTGNDTIIAEGNGQVLGGKGADVIRLVGPVTTPFTQNIAFGGDHNDTIYGSGLKDEVLVGDAGNDVLYLGANVVGIAQIASGGDGNDRIVSGGGSGLAIMIGDAGNDTLIAAGTGEQNLWGGLGNDSMVGGDGLNKFIIGEGSDTAVGGAGEDWFVLDLAASQTTATVLEFALDDDLIILDQVGHHSQQETFDLFMANADQVGADVVFDNGEGDIMILKDIQLAELSLANFRQDDFPTLVGTIG